MARRASRGARKRPPPRRNSRVLPPPAAPGEKLLSAAPRTGDFRLSIVTLALPHSGNERVTSGYPGVTRQRFRGYLPWRRRKMRWSFVHRWNRIAGDEQGATMSEYLILGLVIALVTVGGMLLLG